MANSIGAVSRRFFETIRVNGGIRGCCWKLLRGEDLRIGTLIGEDRYGNRYYQNNNYFVARHRWVEYRKDRYWDFDASLVPPEWHRWLHLMTDEPPTTAPLIDRKFIWKEHEENLSGTKRQYVPSTTTRPKIEEWIPPKQS
ncbi:putative NADH dehydrogenase [Apostichopus japonicus]|uniref:NADH dehydrogenase [ubiquinone] 1 alpha subcomplex subunit 12 n=2 Tax=Stichopus japonicus TaxID=307972 RepID=A0A2G8JYS6_STIJA|nr:putative NADH dehydrogenase [Apostichopus japonicus]